MMIMVSSRRSWMTRVGEGERERDGVGWRGCGGARVVCDAVGGWEKVCGCVCVWVWEGWEAGVAPEWGRDRGVGGRREGGES